MSGPDSPLDARSATKLRPRIRKLGGGPDESSRDDIFFAAIQTTRMPMIITDPHQPDNPIVFANEAFLDMTGYSEAEIEGHNCRFLQGEETSRETVREIRDAILGERDIACEILNYRKDGGSFWNALFISPVRDQNGKVIFFFASQLDVSRRRDAERALQQSQKMEAIGQLTGGIAHDFNNLLQVMSGHLGRAQNQLKQPGPDLGTVSHGHERIAASIQKAATLTSQLLAFARKQTLADRVINLSEALHGMLQLARGTLGDAIVLDEQLDPGLWNCRVDPTQTEVALLNLLINARHAMGGSGTITVGTSNVSVTNDRPLNGLAHGRYAMFFVADSGHGIPEEHLAHVMEPFFTTKNEGEGTGLGLAMVYGFARQSQGAVRIESKVAIGTTVRLYFPAIDQPVARPARRLRHEVVSGEERILVVDDRAEVAEIAGFMLEDMGYRVSVFHTPQAAVDMLSSGEAFDLLLTDVIMPGDMNGVALARRARHIQPTIKVLLATGYAESSIEPVGGERAQFDMILKPYAQEELARKVRQILDGPTGVG